MKTLIQVQDEALAKLNVSRSSERRYEKLAGSVYRWYIAEVAKIGITNEFPKYLANGTWDDVRDVSKLQQEAE